MSEMHGEPPGYQVMGNDSYGRNERIRLPDGAESTAEDIMGWYEITKEYYQRDKKPVMHTETNTLVLEDWYSGEMFEVTHRDARLKVEV